MFFADDLGLNSDYTADLNELRNYLSSSSVSPSSSAASADNPVSANVLFSINMFELIAAILNLPNALAVLSRFSATLTIQLRYVGLITSSTLRHIHVERTHRNIAERLNESSASIP